MMASRVEGSREASCWVRSRSSSHRQAGIPPSPLNVEIVEDKSRRVVTLTDLPGIWRLCCRYAANNCILRAGSAVKVGMVDVPGCLTEVESDGITPWALASGSGFVSAILFRRC